MASNTEVSNSVLTAVEHCLSMQAEHMAGLKRGCLTKINQWLEERQAMVARLQQALAAVQPAEVDADFRELLLDRIGCILDREKTLYSIAEQQRGGLSEQISSIRRGRRALHGYGPATSDRAAQFVRDKG